MYKATRVFAAAAAPLGCVCRSGQQNIRLGNTANNTALSSSSLASASSQPQVRFLSAASMPKNPSFPSTPAMRAAVRLQHTSSAAGAAAPSADAAPNAPAHGGDVRVDPSRLPSTIPGISQEELAARITSYHTKKSQEASVFSSQAVGQEIELMRRSLSPNDFQEYMVNLEKGMAKAAKEQAKLAAMSPLELHQYQHKKKRQAVRYEWYKSFMMLFALVGSTALLFSLFVFFE